MLYECGKEEQVILSLEQGIIGGVPATGTDFGIAFNPQAILCETNQFDWYDGGGLDVAVLSFAEFDRQGNVNVSKFNGKINGVGGFINISQNARKLVFTGTFTASGLVERCGGGKLEILREGAYKKLREQVEQISFSGVYASQAGQEVDVYKRQVQEHGAPHSPGVFHLFQNHFAVWNAGAVEKLL